MEGQNETAARSANRRIRQRIMTIRRASEKDIPRINHLLFQIHKVHSDKRPDIFRCGNKKYNDEELLAIIKNDSTPIYVAVDDTDTVLGYAFCIHQITKGDTSLADRRVLYIDDLCVDEECRGGHIGTKLCDYVMETAKTEGFDTVTLNVWCLNETAMKFYEKCGFSPLKIYMEKFI